MSAQLLRGPGPDKRFEMSESKSADRPAHEDKAGPAASKLGKRRTWIPGIASLLRPLIGPSHVLAIFRANWPANLHRFGAHVPVPGLLTNSARSAEVIIGLMLLLLSHG